MMQAQSDYSRCTWETAAVPDVAAEQNGSTQSVKWQPEKEVNKKKEAVERR